MPASPGRRQLRASIERYRETYGLGPVSIGAPDAAPDLEPLRAASIPLSLRR